MLPNPFMGVGILRCFFFVETFIHKSADNHKLLLTTTDDLEGPKGYFTQGLKLDLDKTEECQTIFAHKEKSSV